MEFPHIDDTQFPNLDNVNVYKYQNDFNYARWQGKVIYKLINVLWNSTCSDVPYFQTDEERDTWFDSQEGHTGVLESVFNNTPESSIKIPVPYNDAYKYNYLVLEMPLQTSAEDLINYENSEHRISRWYFFIEDMVQSAPNTTELEIVPDYWTMFVNTISIPYLMLERGHAPMTKITVEEFLNNPILNNEYLLADDFNYGNETVIQTSNYMPIGSGTKYVLFCAPYSLSDFSAFGGSSFSGEATPPTFSNINNRWGYQLQVNDYAWAYGDTDYTTSNLPIHNQVQNGILNGCSCFAIRGSDAMEFFNDCAKYCVNFIHGIQAMFILDESLFTKGENVLFRGKTIYSVAQKTNLSNINLTKEQFGFDTKYANITKLYTAPYSFLEITDDNGNIFNAKIENCGQIQMHTEVSLVYPFLNYNIFFSGINGDGELNYIWKNLNDYDVNKKMWASDFAKFMMNWDIPTYSIFISAEDEYAANNFWGMAAKRSGAIMGYENAVRYSNTTRANTADSFDTATTNVGATGATNTANVNRSTSAMTANVNADMATMVSNTEVACDTATANVTQVQNPKSADITTANNSKISSDAAVANSTTIALTGAQNDLATITYGNSATAAVTSSAIGAVGNLTSGLASQGLTGGVAGGLSGVASQLQTFCAVQCSGANLLAGISNNQDVANITTAATAAYAANAQYCNNAVLNAQQIINAQLTSNNNDSSRTQAAATAATNNADASRTKSAEDSNASATQSTNNANATRTQTTETNNAGYNRDATVAAEKAILVQKQIEQAAQYKNARLQRPTTQGAYSGDFMPDVYQRRGVRLNVRTQTKAAIAQAGDAMLRFGYALHRNWDMSNGFHYGKHFTFWKAEDVWINDGTGAANVATNTIGNILMQGVTVWRNPDEIGTIGIYDNI